LDGAAGAGAGAGVEFPVVVEAVLLELPVELPPFELAVALPPGVPDVALLTLEPAEAAENGFAAPEPHPVTRIAAIRPALNLSITWVANRNLRDPESESSINRTETMWGSTLAISSGGCSFLRKET
jgi:hypothetical protein